MVNVVPFKKELLKDFKYNGVDKEYSGQEVLPIIEFYAHLGSCYIGLVDDKILGVGGIYPLWKSAGGCFLFLNREAHDYKKSVFKILLEYMNMLLKQYEIKTLIVECQNDSLEAHTLIRHLGFIRNRQVTMAVYAKKLGE